jgi:DNA-binding PadR family transcriptional regulator
MADDDTERLERSLLLHLLEHRGQQIRFEADQWTTEFGIARKFANEDPSALKHALHALEMTRMVFRRTQYVVGYSEPKHVFSLTPSGHRKALEHLREEGGPNAGLDEEPDDSTPRGPSRDRGARAESSR